MEITPGNVLTTFSVLIGMATLAFGLVKWVQAQVKEVRSEARAENVRLDSKVDRVREECARREDLHALGADVRRIGERLEDKIDMLNGRLDRHWAPEQGDGRHAARG